MKAWLIAWLAAASFAAAEIPSVEDAIPDAVKALPAPVAADFPAGIQMAVTAASADAQASVLQGLNHLHSGWEFEATRHFAVAMREDPDCLLATWGMVVALLAPSPDTASARIAAGERLLDLVDRGIGSDLERGYAYGIIKYLREGPAEASNAFHKVAEKFPNDLQAAIFSALFGRGGYDDFGDPTPDQERSEKILSDLVAEHPANPIPLHALLLIRAEAPDVSATLPLARKLTQLNPGYAPYHHVLGHYEWRAGQHGPAASAFGRASSLFTRWMKDNHATAADAPEWIKAECYRVVALASKGDFETADAAARQIAATPLPEDRLTSPGARMLLWEAKTLPARLLMSRGAADAAKTALETLPSPDTLQPTVDKSLAYWWIDGLRLYLDARRLLDAGDLEEAMKTAAVLSRHGQRMASLQSAATESGERSSWTRAFHSLESLAAELNGRVALAGPKSAHGSAYNWFRSATDSQHFASLLYPPALLSPMHNRLGEYYLAINEPQKSIEAYNESLTRFPNDIDSLRGLQRAYKLADQPDAAADTATRIEQLLQQ